MELVRNIIDGKVVSGSSGETMALHNPATGKEIARIELSTEEDVDRAVAAAKRAQKEWNKALPAERGKILNDIVADVEQNIEQLCQLEIEDTGKPVTMARGKEFPGILDALRYFSNVWRGLQGQPAGNFFGGATTYVQREPVGVVTAITPWNYPLWQAIWKIIPAVAVGNAVVVKPSEITPRSTTRFVEILQNHLPHGLVNLVQGTGPDIGDRLVTHSDVELVSFTGSTRTGRMIAGKAAQRPKKTIMELGGNAPVIVLSDVDIPAVAEKIADAALWNTGQECQAATRILVHEDIHDEFLVELVKSFEKHNVGDPQLAETTIGPLTSEAQLAKVTQYVEMARYQGTIHTGGKRLDRDGYFFAPTVISGLGQSNPVIQEEIFGPVSTVQPFSSVEEAIEMANDVEYGLAGSVWTNNTGLGIKVLNELDFGNVWLNAHLVLGPDVPIGGFKASGFGKEGGLPGFEEFTRVKQVALAYGDEQ